MIAKSCATRSQGFVLIAVVVVLAMLSLSAYTFTHWVTMELEVVDLEGKRLQARLLAESGKSLVEALALLEQRGYPAPEISDNPALFEGIVVVPPEDLAGGGKLAEASTTQGESTYSRFSVFSESAGASDPLASAALDEQMVRFGVEREGGKIHLNEWMVRDSAALTEALLKLPNATTELVDAVLDWMDKDDQKRSNGAENTEYEALQPPMGCRNGPLESLDELLLVKGMTREILYGEDTNRNGQLDPNEDDGEETLPWDDQDGQLNRGWWPFLTLYSRESNVDSKGRPRIFLNDPDIGRLYGMVLNEFGEELARLIIGYRLVGSDVNTVTLEPGAVGKFIFPSVLRLIDLKVNGIWDKAPISFESPFNSSDAASLERFANLYDRMTVHTQPEFVGKLDLGSAPAESLALLTMLAEEKRQAILERRPVPQAPSPGQTSKANSATGVGAEGASSVGPQETLIWLLTDSVLTLPELMGIENVVTMRSPVIRFQAAGFFDDAQVSARIEVVLDRDRTPPMIVMQHNLDRLGTGVPLVLLGQGGEKKELPTLGSDRGSE